MFHVCMWWRMEFLLYLSEAILFVDSYFMVGGDG